ncbi:MAG: DUF6320 domain-containing protein [bacterium]
MKFCRNCNVYLNSEDITCPLCDKESMDKSKVANVQGYEGFPKRSNLDLKESLINFAALFLCLCTIVLNVSLYSSFNSLFSIYMIIIILILKKHLMFNKNNLSNKILSTHIVFLCLAFLMDTFILENNISLEYVLPISSSIVLITLFFLGRKEKYQDYFGNIVFHLVLCFIPMILYFSTTIVTNSILSFVSLLIGLISMLVCIVKKETKNELKKRLHL